MYIQYSCVCFLCFRERSLKQLCTSACLLLPNPPHDQGVGGSWEISATKGRSRNTVKHNRLKVEAEGSLKMRTAMAAMGRWWSLQFWWGHQWHSSKSSSIHPYSTWSSVVFSVLHPMITFVHMHMIYVYIYICVCVIHYDSIIMYDAW